MEDKTGTRNLEPILVSGRIFTAYEGIKPRYTPRDAMISSISQMESVVTPCGPKNAIRYGYKTAAVPGPLSLTTG